MRLVLRNLKSGHVPRPRLAMVVFGNPQNGLGAPHEGYGHCTCPTCPAHSSTAVVLETHTSCCGCLKNSGNKIAAIRLRGAPRRVQPLIGTAHVLLRGHSRKPPFAELRASWVACCALLCAVKAASCVYTHAAAMSHLMSLRHESLCIVYIVR